MTRFVLSATTLQFNCDPLRPGGERPQLFQQTGRDSSGDLYIYSKSRLQRSVHRLHFARIDLATKIALLSFFSTTAQGVKNSFTWIDFAEVARTVRFAETKLQIVPGRPGQYAVKLTLTEDLP